MIPDTMVQEMFDIFKTSSEATWKTITLLQHQTEHMANLLYEQSSALQKEENAYLKEWINNTKKSQTQLQKAYFSGINGIVEIIKPMLEWEFEFDIGCDSDIEPR